MSTSRKKLEWNELSDEQKSLAQEKFDNILEDDEERYLYVFENGELTALRDEDLLSDIFSVSGGRF